MNLLSAARNVEYAATHGTLPVLDLRPYFNSTDTPGIDACIALIDTFEDEHGMKPVEVIAPRQIRDLLGPERSPFATTQRIWGVPLRIA